MAMTEDSTGMGGSLWGVVIFFILLFFIFDKNSNSNGGNANGGIGMAPPAWLTAVNDEISNCQVEKQAFANAAATNLLIEQKSNALQLDVMAEGTKTREKIDFYAYEGLKDQLAQERMENMALKGQIYSDGRFNALEMQMAGISANMPQRPPFYSAGGLPCATIYPTGCGGGDAFRA